ncbi:unnamed protein product [Tilletia laevis]|uniref:C2H2-type domain-containing protein n=1 Tax=Tilletia caries TaxID=13290 RepID=A0ABN7ISI2_9BASI|nr:unnamed protein product [Tilletia caries]CAD6925926.1 unnamed protein product [Tilletia laevis]
MSTVASQHQSLNAAFHPHPYHLAEHQLTHASHLAHPPSSSDIFRSSSNTSDNNSSGHTPATDIHSATAPSQSLQVPPLHSLTDMPPSTQPPGVGSYPPSAAGFAAWEHANGNARPHTADALFEPSDPKANGADPPNSSVPGATNSTPGRPSLVSNYSSGSSRVFAYMPTSNSDEFTPPAYGSFDSSYSPYQAPDTASTSNVSQNGAATGRDSIASASGSGSNHTEGTSSAPNWNPASAPRKRPRRRYDEIERMYPCNWSGCAKSYGTLNHLNAHVAMQKHGLKRLPHEFKEMRKQWRKARRDEDQRRQSSRNSVSGPSSTFPHGVNAGNGTSQQHRLSGSSVPTAPDDPYMRNARFDSFSSAPGGYAGEAGGEAGSYYGGPMSNGGGGATAPYYPPVGYAAGGPRGSNTSLYSYATAPSGGSHHHHQPPPPPPPHHHGSGSAGSGHWVTPYGTTSSSTTGHMFPPPPAGPGRSYSMSSAAPNVSATAGSAADSSSSSSSGPGTGTAGGWSTGNSYATAPPPPHAGGAYSSTHHGSAYGGGHSYGGGSGYGGYGGAGGGGLSVPSTSAGPPGLAGGGGAPTSNSSAAAAAAAGGLGAYLMAHRGSI